MLEEHLVEDMKQVLKKVVFRDCSQLANATVGYRQQIADLEAAKAKSDETIRQMT